MVKMFFNEYSMGIRENFKDVHDVRTFSKICLDTYRNKLQGQTQAEGNSVILQKFYDIAGFTEKPNDIQVRRALQNPNVRWAYFEIIQETIDQTLITGWANDPWFKKYVETKILALGNRNLFYVKSNDLILNISKIADGHHNVERNRLNRGSEFSVKTSRFGCKVYLELSRFLQGVEDWNELIDAISRSYTLYVNTLIHDQVIGAIKKLPVQTKWNQKGLPSSATKKAFKTLIADVKRANGSGAMIMGTDVALGELTGFADVTWMPNEAKSDVYNTGRLGTFEGTPVVELPQAFAFNDETKNLEADDFVFIMPDNIDQFVKLYYEGADQIVERTTLGQNADDTMDYEFQTTFGVETIVNRRFGVWKFEA